MGPGECSTQTCTFQWNLGEVVERDCEVFHVWEDTTSDCLPGDTGELGTP